jgi:hypothetical protein
MHSFQEIVRLSENNLLGKREKEGCKIQRQQLVNVLNYMNFQNKTILGKFRHKKYNTIIALQFKPHPCLNDQLKCSIFESSDFLKQCHSFELLYLLINNGQKMIIVKPEINSITDNCIQFILPKTSHELNFRKAQRHPCNNVNVELIQNGASFQGDLIDFSYVSFSMRLFYKSSHPFQWINPKATVMVIFKRANDIIYSGTCHVARQNYEHEIMKIVVVPVANEISRFQPKMFRSFQQKLVPSPTIFFCHPLTEKTIRMDVYGLSCADLSCEEYSSGATLFTGLIIPNMDIEFAPNFKIECRAQVVKQCAEPSVNENSMIRWNISFLDMNIQEQVQLSNLLYQAENKNTHVCTRLDMDALWKFFFETGFFYPKKYSSLHINKEQFKIVYERLYNHHPEIAHHFIFQDKGIIYGHIAMIRFYEKTWLIHHHAAKRPALRNAGLIVLNQIGRYINNFSWLESTHMQYVICYYRPENKFPNHVFGGFADYLNNPEHCSIDELAYCHLPEIIFSSEYLQTQLKNYKAHLEKASLDDIVALNHFYKGISGGLLLDALDLKPESMNKHELELKYRELNFKREKHLFSLRVDGCLKAIIMMTLSDIGLNLSNLTNCFHVLILDSESLSSVVLVSALQLSMINYTCTEMQSNPVLIYPENYAKRQNLLQEKVYKLWIFDIRYSDQYFQYMADIYPSHSA